MSRRTGSPETARVSVVIPVHNGAGHLEQSLSAVFRSSYHDMEVIVVDDCSQDGSAQIARRFPCRVIQLPGRSGPATARNVGCAYATGDIFFFTDADVSVGCGVIEKAVRFLSEHREVAGVIGAYAPDTPSTNFLSVYKNLQHHFVHWHSGGPIAGFFTACGAIRRESFQDAGGFSEFAKDCALEDVELGMRLFKRGHTIVLRPELAVTHLKRYSLRMLIYSDIFQRAIPYTRHILHHGLFRDELSTGRRNRLSVALVYAALIAIAVAFLSKDALLLAATAAAGCCGQLLLNWDFYAFLRQQRGVAFATKAFGFHFLYYAYCGIGLGIGGLLHVRAMANGAAFATEPHRLAHPASGSLRLGLNENLLGPPESIVRLLPEALKDIHRYPDDSGSA